MFSHSIIKKNYQIQFIFLTKTSLKLISKDKPKLAYYFIELDVN